MKYVRSAMEIESAEEVGYDNIQFNFAESSIMDGQVKDIPVSLDELVLEYGSHQGKTELREIIAADGDGLKADDVLTTMGAGGALFALATTLLEPGDHVVVGFPNYAINLQAPRVTGANVDLLEQTFEGGFRVDIEELAERVTAETKFVSLTCPHNPTGSVLSMPELEKIVELVEERGSYLILDEIYREMHHGEPLPPAATFSPRVISVASLSKTYGLPGLRLGWLICRDADLMETLLAAKEAMHISHSVVLEELAYAFLLDKDAHVEKTRQDIAAKFAVVKGWMEGQDYLEWVEPSGGVTCFPRLKADLDVDVDRFYEVLNDKYGTYVGPGHWFEVDRRYMRIGFGWPSKDQLQQGLGNITRAVGEAMRA